MIGIATAIPTFSFEMAAIQHMLPRFQQAPAAMPGTAARLLVA